VLVGDPREASVVGFAQQHVSAPRLGAVTAGCRAQHHRRRLGQPGGEDVVEPAPELHDGVVVEIAPVEAALGVGRPDDGRGVHPAHEAMGLRMSRPCR
jgi:hypothetical protein